MAGFTNPDFTGMGLGESPSADSKEWRALFEGETGRTFEALTHKTGARGLRSIIEGIMRNVMYEVPSIQGVTACQVTKDVIVNHSDPILTIDGAGAVKMAVAN